MSVRYCAVVALTGVGAGVAGGLFTLLLHGIQHVAFGYTENSFLFGVQHASYERRVLVLIIAGLIAGFGWYALRRWVGESRSVSSAVWGPDGRMQLIPAVADATLQIVVVALGASLGREGAPRQAGAAWASQLSDWTGLSDEQRRLLMACGAGAGLAAVYNVPLGGAVFTLEVLLVSISLSSVLPAIMTSVIATLVARAFLGDHPTYTVVTGPSSATLTVFALVAGPLCGVLAVGFIALIDLAKRGVRPRGWKLVASTTVVFGALGAASLAYPQLLGNGKGPAQLSFDGQGSLLLFAALVVLKPVATAACLRSGAVGGLFTPALATGALFGAAIGRIWLDAWPGSPLGAFAVVGAAAVLAAAVRAPIASAILIFELARVGSSALVPILIAVVGATLVARLLGTDSIYTAGASTRRLRPPQA
jgi:H+/Cl- antiporter ClcA